ncbi:hypothetical protein L6R29_07060 [Myxococcota bacterium]|nr:hypothetical protein [Myxococcota bacterium]
MNSSKKNNIHFLADLAQSTKSFTQDALASEGLEVASPEDQMNAYLYALLSEEESKRVEAEIASSPQCQTLHAQAQQQQSLLTLWHDQEPPAHLLAKTLARLGFDDDADVHTHGTVNPIGTTAC